MVILTTGDDFTNYLHALFMSVNNTVKLPVILVVLESVLVKVARKMLVKMTTGEREEIVKLGSHP